MLRRLVIGSAAVAHGLAWAAFLWLVFWPFSHSGVTTQLPPAGSDAAPQVTYTSDSFIEANGLWVVLPFLIPVAVTGLALLAAWRWNPSGWTRPVSLGVLAVLMFGFCVLGMFSFGVFFVPAFLASAITAVVSSFPGARGTGVGTL
jgi:hypothetical protein